MVRGRALALLGAVGAAALAGCGGGGSTGTPTIKWYVFNEPSGAFPDAAKRCTAQARGRYKVDIVALPTDADQQRELIVRRLAAKDSSIDVIGMDVIWTAEFAEAGWIEPWSGANRAAAEGGVIPALLASAKYKNTTYAAPFTTNTQLLWYHKDVVKRPPATWAEMVAQAKRIGGAKGKIVVQGRRYEGLVVWFNSLVASAGGQIMRSNGQPVLGAPAVLAAQTMKTVASPPVAPSGVSNLKEDTGNDAFKGSDLAFMVNYPFVYASVADDKKAVANLGFARYPSVRPGEPSHVTFGGVNLGVSRYSKRKALAFEAARCLKSDPNQIDAYAKGGLAPTQSHLYSNPQVLKAAPYTKVLEATLRDGVARPLVPAYSDVSLAIQSALHPPGSIDPRSAIKDLRGKLKKAEEGKLF